MITSHSPKYRHCDYLGKLLQVDKLAVTVDRALKALSFHRFDAIAFRGMSGALIAPILALKTGKTLIMVRKRGDGSHSAWHVEGDIAAQRYIIVDDLVCTGHTAKTIIREIREEFNESAKCIGVLEVLNLPEDTSSYTHQTALHPVSLLSEEW